MNEMQLPGEKFFFNYFHSYYQHRNACDDARARRYNHNHRLINMWQMSDQTVKKKRIIWKAVVTIWQTQYWSCLTVLLSNISGSSQKIFSEMLMYSFAWGTGSLLRSCVLFQFVLMWCTCKWLIRRLHKCRQTKTCTILLRIPRWMQANSQLDVASQMETYKIRLFS